jgi:hypothetical protein
MNELLQNLKLPGIVCRLPSRGLFYDDGVLSENVVNGEVEVRPMSAYDEISLRNISDIINGKSISNVFKTCIPDILQPDELFSKDVDLLLLVLRQVTYGNNITIQHQHTCKDAKTHKYDINVGNLINSTKFIDPTTINDLYQVVMDNGSVVMLHPMKFKDFLDLMKNAKDYDTLSNSEMQRRLLDATVNVIKSVDDISDSDKILEWARAIPAKWFEKITNALNLGNEWGSSNSSFVDCKDCNENFEISLPINSLTFFLDY